MIRTLTTVAPARPSRSLGSCTRHPALAPVRSTTCTRRSRERHQLLRCLESGRPAVLPMPPPSIAALGGRAGSRRTSLIKSQSLKDRTGTTGNNHSITETYVRDAAGHAFEFGVSSDVGNKTTRPTLFTTAWTAGKFDGYSGLRVDQARLAWPFNPPVGQSPEFGYAIIGSKIWFTYWRKAVRLHPRVILARRLSRGDRDADLRRGLHSSPGGSHIPTMNGTVSHYQTSTRSHLAKHAVSSPYRIGNISETGFTFSWADAARGVTASA